MKIAFFDAKTYDQIFFDIANSKYKHTIKYFEQTLQRKNVELADGFDGVCCFIRDNLSASVLEALAKRGIKLIALRCAGFDHVDVTKAKEFGLTVVHVPKYSPHAVAEHAIALILALNRKIPHAYDRVKNQNFSIQGLMGFDLIEKTVGVIGTGRIGSVFAKLMHGFGCKLLGVDPIVNQDCLGIGLTYTTLMELYKKSDIISIHCPLNAHTKYLINEKAIASMKKGVMIINTSRGKVIDTQAIIKGLKDQHIGFVGLDVYEEESQLFYNDLTNDIIVDDMFMRLIAFPNVIVTAHQGFFTKEAMTKISEITLSNITSFEKGNEDNKIPGC